VSLPTTLPPNICDTQAGNERQQIKRAAQALGLDPVEVGAAIEKIKDAVGLRGDQNVDVNPVTGDVTYGGEAIGNVNNEDNK